MIYLHKRLPIHDELMVGEQQEHVRERDALARLMRYASLVVQSIVKVLPPLDRHAIDPAKQHLGLAEILPVNHLSGPRLSVRRILGQGHDPGDTELCGIDLDLEDTAQFLRTQSVRK